jgi:Uma2 family endonuclease
LQPDVFVADVNEVRTLDWAEAEHLLLAVEVLSPSAARADRFPKRRLYQEPGVPVYWVIDADRCEVDVSTPADTFVVAERERLSRRPEGADAEFALDLAELFRPL